MASVSSRSRASGLGLGCGHVQFSDVAKFVGASLRPGRPQPRPTSLSSAASWRAAHVLDCSPQERSSCDLPELLLPHGGAQEKNLRSSAAQQLAGEIDSLRTEQWKKNMEVKTLEKTLSDSALLQQSAKTRAEVGSELLDLQRRRVHDMNKEISSLEQELYQSRPTSVAASSSAPNLRKAHSESASTAVALRRPVRSIDLAHTTHFTSGAECLMYIPEDLSHSKAEVAEFQREWIRDQLIERVGSTAKKAFQRLDLNGSGHVSCQDFADGLSRLGIPWQDVTGMKRSMQVFKLFDQDKDGVIDFAELFPTQANAEEVPQRVSTPEFWKTWCRRNPKSDFPGEKEPQRPSKWMPASPEEELNRLFDSQRKRQEVVDQRKWMSASFRRLKNKGKSDARARECIASHLPRGTGPRDRDACGTFSEIEVRACRKSYQDQVSEPVKNVQKIVYDMREQRRLLQTYKMQLHHITMEPYLRLKQEEDRKQAASSFAGLGFLSQQRETDDQSEHQVEAAAGQKPLSAIARDCKMEDDVVQKIFKHYIDASDKKIELVGKKGFGRLVQEICLGRTFADDDLEEWWNTAKGRNHSGDPEAAQNCKSRRNMCNFEQVVTWYANSELRAG